MTDSDERPAELSRTDRDALARLESFRASHGAGCVAVVNHVGRVGTRIVIIAPGGEFGDVLVSSDAMALDLCRRAGLEVREWDRETTGLLAPSAADRRVMGSRAR